MVIPNSVTSIGKRAFQNNSMLKKVTISGTGAIKQGAFNGIFGTSGIALVIKNGITSIGDKAFSSKKLTSVVISPSVTSIGNSAFKDNKLTSVTLSQALYNKRGDAFDGNPAGLRFYEYDASQRNNKGRYLGTN